jgi:integrase/recombinase XerD
MRNRTAPVPGRSALGPLMAQLIQEKRAAGYGYIPQSYCLDDLDRFLAQEGLIRIELPKDLARRWCAKRVHECASTHRSRIYVLRQLAEFLGRRGYPAWSPDPKLTTIPRYDFVPHIFSVEEVGKLFAAADALDHGAWSLRHLIMPEIFRVLYGCGLRAGEALDLTVGDVDLNEGVLTIRQGKFRKDRLVPLAPSLRDRLRRYADRMGDRAPEAIFFPGRAGGPCGKSTLYDTFRGLLWKAGIAHGGRGRGPRLHDLRHNADFRIMPMGTLVIRVFGPFPRPLDWPLAKTTRHNPDILLARWLGRQSLSHLQPGQFRPDDELLAFLEGL